MTIQNLNSLFQPQSVAIIGDRDPLSAIVAGNLAASGFAGEVWMVNAGISAQRPAAARDLPRVEDLPGKLDLAIVCNPSVQVPDIARRCGLSGARGMAILTHGFREAGPQGRQIEQALQQELRRFPKMRVLGPNCIGLLAPHWNLNATSAKGLPQPGRVAFISQSATLGSSALDWAIQEDIGFSYFVSVGNMIEVGFSDLIDYFANDPFTDAIILFVESIDLARPFMSAARATSKKKPIVVLKAGRYRESAEAAASHTGAMAGVDAVYEAAFERAGVVRVDEIDDMFDCAQLLARHCRAIGPRLGIVTNAGGPGVVAADCLLHRQGRLAQLSAETIVRLGALLPSPASCRNPVDLMEDAGPERFARAADIVLQDAGVDALMVILTPQAMTDATAVADAVAGVAQRSSKPVLAVWMGGPAVREGMDRLHRAGIPTYATPKNAVHAFMHLVNYARRREILYETPRMILVDLPTDKPGREAAFRRILQTPEEILSEQQSKQLLQLYGIDTTQPELASSADEAVQLAERTGYPVVLKIVSPQILHKNEVGGVALNLASAGQVRAAFDQMLARVRSRRGDATIEGISVQPMFVTAEGFELILGSRKDPAFGAVVLIGAGGVAAEVIDDTALGLPPLNEKLARRMLESLRCWPILTGYRARPAVNVDQLLATLIRFSHLVAECPEIAEMDVNPIVATPAEVVALDARVKIDRGAIGQVRRPYAHLAIRPYPDELVQHTRLSDGTPVTLRPIRPEDEPAWHDMLARCSPESIRSRFRLLFKEMTHEMATSYCFIDYDRELVIVAEVDVDGRRRLVGSGHLACDLSHEEAEYAVLVCDEFQRRGLGRMLTERCLEIAASWGLKQVVGETTPGNRPMIATFKRCGFDIDCQTSLDSIQARYELARNRSRPAPTDNNCIA